MRETTVRVYRRYLMFNPSCREDLVTYLEEIGQYEEAARQLSVCVNDDAFVSRNGHTKHQLWIKLCEMCASHPTEISKSLNVDTIIRSGIARFSDEVGKLWCRLADFYTRMGQFEKARDVFEEAIRTVITVRDFTVIFDAYAKFEEAVLTAKMQMIQAESEDSTTDLQGDIELRMARLEYIMDQRPIWLNSVVLRQNPHNVNEWHKRAKLFLSKGANVSDKSSVSKSKCIESALLCYLEAVQTVDPKLAQGRLSSLWTAFARVYEENGDLDNARSIFKRATNVQFRSSEELAGVWCAWAEMEMKHKNYEAALNVMRSAVLEPIGSSRKVKVGEGLDEAGAGGGPSDRAFKSTLVWNLYLDLEESLGTVDTCRSAYERAMDLKVITPKMCLNFANFLEENNFFEDSFRVYERAVLLFTFPHVKPIWLQYLDKFIARYEGTKLERLRDLFEQSIKDIPAADAAEFYVKYAKVEEQFGLARHALAIYDRATRAVPEPRRLDMYRLYITKVEQYYGITKTRPVYERAIGELKDEMSKALCLEFSAMERKLGEIDRARGIFRHGSQFADPKRDPDYWAKWRDFEEAHGNEETFRDMLRVQRSVVSAYSQVCLSCYQYHFCLLY